MTLVFHVFTPKRWDLKRWQPEIFLADERERPFAVPRVDGGLVVADGGERPRAALHARFPVASFGEVTLPTGLLPARSEPYNLNVEIARERIARVEAKAEEWSRGGFVPSRAFGELLDAAKRVYRFVDSDESEERKSRWADLSLSHSLPAGERLALDFADWGIRRRRSSGGFAGFLLGANCFWYPERANECGALFTESFNYATLPFYWSRVEPVKGELRLENLDAQVAWLGRNGLKKKGHPLFWYLSLPAWVDLFSDYSLLQAHVRERIQSLCGRYRGRVEYYDVVNEMHNWNVLSKERMYELTRLACSCARAADPLARLVVNVNEPFGEYMARDVLHLDRTMVPIDVKRQLATPEDYVEELLREEVDFDAIGVQMYYGAGAVFCRDLFEISRYFDKYERFGKEVHLTEMGVPSAEGPDPLDSSHVHNYCGDTPWRASDSGFWHGPWTEELQAEFIDGCYRVLMGKPFIKAITYWDFCDAFPHFFTHCGLVDRDLKPKKSYEALLKLGELAGIRDRPAATR